MAALQCLTALSIWCATFAVAFAQSPSPPSTSQVSQEPVTVGQLLSMIAERDRQYTQRFEAQEKALSFALVNLNQRFEAQDKSTTVALSAAEKAVQAALIAAKEAVQKAEVASEKRFDSVNEFRNTLKDQQLLLMTRSEAEARFKDFDRRIQDNAEQVSARAAEARGAAVLWGYIIGGIGALLGVLGIVLGLLRKPGRAR